MKKIIILALFALSVCPPLLAQTRPVTVTVVDSGTADSAAVSSVSNGRNCLVGFSITEDAETPAVAELRILHGATSAGTELFVVTLSAGESTRELNLPCIPVGNGIFIDRISGTTRLTLFTSRF